MQELNLTVGQNVWSIQLGDCVVVEIRFKDEYPIICENKDGLKQSYVINGDYEDGDFHKSLFESNPFEKENTFEKRYEKTIQKLQDKYGEQEYYPQKIDGEWAWIHYLKAKRI